MMDEGPRKKQKAAAGRSIKVTALLKDDDTAAPVFALFPSGQPSKSCPFSLYSKNGTNWEASSVLAAQTDVMEYESRNQLGHEEGVGDDRGYSTQYMLGVHDPKTNSLTLQAAPLHSLSTAVKALKSLPSTQTASQMYAQRALLGSTFGTRKAIRSINAEARNKLDHESFGRGTGLQELLLDSIASSSKTLPTAEIIETAANLNRPIPPPNFEAQTPGEVYNFEDVVSEAELNAISLDPLLQITDPKEQDALLPFRRSMFIRQRIRPFLSKTNDGSAEPSNPSKKERNRLKLLVHLSYLFALRQAAPAGQDRALERSKISNRLGDPPSVVVDSLLNRYTDLQRTGTGAEDKRKMTSFTETKLLSYMLTVVLKVDGWGTDVGAIANDLGIGTKKVQELFRSLGCTIVTPSAGEREMLVRSGAASSLVEARKSKRAVLRVPLQFPKEKRGPAKR